MTESNSVHEESVTGWIENLANGDPFAAQKILDRYIGRLVWVASRRLNRRNRGMADEEDIVMIAFNQFVQGVGNNRFTRLRDRNDLWQILFMLTDRRAIDQVRKRECLFTESVLEYVDDSENRSGGISTVPDVQPSQEYTAIFLDEFKMKLTKLSSENRKIVTDLMNGLSKAEISKKYGLSSSTVHRRVKEIRRVWLESDQ